MILEDEEVLLDPKDNPSVLGRERREFVKEDKLGGNEPELEGKSKDKLILPAPVPALILLLVAVFMARVCSGQD